MKEIEAAFPSHSSLLPPPSDTHASAAAEQMMGLERGLTRAWLKWTKGKDAMRWLAGGSGAGSSKTGSSSSSGEGADNEEEREGRMEFKAAMDAMEAALMKSGGPYFLGREGLPTSTDCFCCTFTTASFTSVPHPPPPPKQFSLVDVTHAPLLERFVASAPYWKGLTVRNNPRWPALSRWYDAMDARPAYLPLKSDDFSITHSLVPQIGPAGSILLRSLGDSAHASAAATAGAAVGAIGAGATPTSSQTQVDQAEPQQQAIMAECLAPAVSEALRHVAHALLVGTEAAGPFPAMSQALQKLSVGSRSEDVRAAGEERLVMALAYLRDRVGVPRD
ncbi:unnamed protein product [Closterium sp. Naga37s-1]|nr:unnamed protein product [Closterium sp. Naga37s-1]